MLIDELATISRPHLKSVVSEYCAIIYYVVPELRIYSNLSSLLLFLLFCEAKQIARKHPGWSTTRANQSQMKDARASREEKADSLNRVVVRWSLSKSSASSDFQQNICRVSKFLL